MRQKTTLLILAVIGCFISGCSDRHFYNGFMVLGAQCYNVSQNKSCQLQPREFEDVLNPICKRASKITQKSTINQIEKDFDKNREYIIRLRYAVFVDDLPAQIEIARDKILRCFNEYYMLNDSDYDSLKMFLNNSMK
jgi:hypothetical protein